VVVDGATTIGWSDTAVAYRGQHGLRLTSTCPAQGRIGSLWGDGVYTDDSSICTAAVHAGVLTAGGGGEVTIEILPGQPAYPARMQHGVASAAWGQWSGSFVVVGGVAAPPPPPGTPTPIGWQDSAVHLRGQDGATARFVCPAGGTPGSVWGSGVYTDDSSICGAAVHAGVISAARGGAVAIAVRPGQASYAASRRNGVTSQAWGTWHGSFVVVGAPAVAAAALPAHAISWSDRAVDLGAAGPVTVFCPPDGPPGSVWGDGIYTDDSSICTAGVHAGLIDFARGGELTLEPRAGEPGYAGTTRHGVTSNGYGAWSGSFVFVAR
jgi:hypothetical protein